MNTADHHGGPGIVRPIRVLASNIDLTVGLVIPCMDPSETRPSLQNLGLTPFVRRGSEAHRVLSPLARGR